MRKTRTYTVTDDNLDKGKTFYLTEMSATAAEAWGARAFQGLTRSGVQVPDNIQGIGVAGLMALGFQALAGIPYAELAPLMDDLMACVQIKPDSARPQVMRPLVEEDIEEVKTLLLLKREVFELTTGFSFAGSRSGEGSDTKTASAA